MTGDAEIARRLSEGRRRRDAGDPAGAFAAFRELARDVPDFADAWLEMAAILAARGDDGRATQALSHGLAAVSDGEGRGRLAQALAVRLGSLRPRDWHAPLERDLVAVLAEDDVDYQRLARVTALTLLAKPGTAASVDAALDAVAVDPLWLAFLTRCLNVDAAMEGRLVALRGALLDRLAESELSTPLGELACAVAIQALAGDHVWPINSGKGAGVRPVAHTPVEALVAASFRPLRPAETRLLAGWSRGRDIGLGRLLLERLIDEPAREATLAAALPALGAEMVAGDAISERVRAQYEESPYPRWRSAPRPEPRTLASIIRALPKVDRDRVARDGGPTGPLRVLVAGCGTGYEAIDLARMDPTLEITALDLSLRSLGYARRMALESGCHRIDFRHGDILALARSGLQFDAAVSTGVLHHMDDPAAGLAAICSVVRSGGLVRIAVYSERARAAVVAAHAVIEAENLSPDLNGIRALRARVMAADADPTLTPLLSSDDFYSASGCRDLLFHAHERRFTLPKLGALLAGARLRLVGFDPPEMATGLFAAAYGVGADVTNLDLWDRLETQHPTLFAGMYAVWGQTPGQAHDQA